MCLAGLLDQDPPGEELSNSSLSYFIHNEARLRKWVPPSVSFTRDPYVQIVMVSTICEPLLKWSIIFLEIWLSCPAWFLLSMCEEKTIAA